MPSIELGLFSFPAHSTAYQASNCTLRSRPHTPSQTSYSDTQSLQQMQVQWMLRSALRSRNADQTHRDRDWLAKLTQHRYMRYCWVRLRISSSTWHCVMRELAAAHAVNPVFVFWGNVLNNARGLRPLSQVDVGLCIVSTDSCRARSWFLVFLIALSPLFLASIGVRYSIPSSLIRPWGTKEMSSQSRIRSLISAWPRPRDPILSL